MLRVRSVQDLRLVQVDRLLIMHALTPLHPGTGQSTGVVDLPVQREVHTQFPMIAASGLKGSLRAVAERVWQEEKVVEVIFGPATRKAADGAGALAVTDARCLAFPVRSLQQVFVWVTCPLVLRRLQRDLALVGLDGSRIPSPPQVERGQALTPPGFATPLVLEELAFAVQAGPADLFAALGALVPGDLARDLAGRVVLVADDDFTHFVRHCTQISVRIHLNDRKTTTGGGGNLWYEETLPMETLLYALLLAEDARVHRDNCPELQPAAAVAGALDALCRERPYLQVGGNETVGQGWCRLQLVKAGEPA